MFAVFKNWKSVLKVMRVIFFTPKIYPFYSGPEHISQVLKILSFLHVLPAKIVCKPPQLSDVHMLTVLQVKKHKLKHMHLLVTQSFQLTLCVCYVCSLCVCACVCSCMQVCVFVQAGVCVCSCMQVYVCVHACRCMCEYDRECG